MTQMFHSGTACLAMLALASTVAIAADQDLINTSGDKPAAKTKRPESTELSVPLLESVEYPSDRPSWLDAESNFQSSTHNSVVVTEPCDSPEACEDLLEVMQRATVSNFVQRITNSDRFDFYPINDKWIEERLVRRTYAGQVTRGSETMYEQAVELTFDQDVQKEIMVAWEQQLVGERLAAMGGLMFVGITLLICGSMFLCMLSRRAERKDAALLAA